MSDAEFQVPIESRGGIETIPISFEAEEVDLDVYLHLKQLKEEYIFEQMFEEL